MDTFSQNIGTSHKESAIRQAKLEIRSVSAKSMLEAGSYFSKFYDRLS